MRAARTPVDWAGLSLNAWWLGFEVAQVIWLRTWLILLGGERADREMRRMVEEKFAAHTAFGWALATGRAGSTPDAVGRKAMRHYGSRVRGNARRLTRS